MIRDAVRHEGMVVLKGILDGELRLDGEPGDGAYELRIDQDTARLLAQGLAEPHAGVRLYRASGSVGPLDGEILAVLEVGTYQAEGRTAVCVTVPQSNRPEDLARLDIEVFESTKAAAAQALIQAAAGD